MFSNNIHIPLFKNSKHLPTECRFTAVVDGLLSHPLWLHLCSSLSHLYGISFKKWGRVQVPRSFSKIYTDQTQRATLVEFKPSTPTNETACKECRGKLTGFYHSHPPYEKGYQENTSVHWNCFEQNCKWMNRNGWKIASVWSEPPNIRWRMWVPNKYRVRFEPWPLQAQK